MGSIIKAKVSQQNSTGVELSSSQGVSCRINVVSENIFRVLFENGRKLRQPNTWSIVPRNAKDTPWNGLPKHDCLGTFPKVPTTTEVRESSVILETALLKLEIFLDPLRLVWYDKEGVNIAADRLSRPYFFSRRNNTIKHYMERNEKDRFHGLGDKTGALNLSGRRLRTVMTDALGYDAETGDPLYKHWPFLIVFDSESKTYYGIMYDNLSSATFDLGCEHSNYYGRYRSYEAEDGDLDYYFIFGPTLAKVISNFLWLTGGMTLGPRWTLGYHCTAMPLADSPEAQEKISEFILLCEKYKIPCSAFHFGSGYTSIGPRRYVFNWNRSKFPDPGHLIGQFKSAGMRVVANLKPCLLTDHPRYDDVAQSGAFITNSETNSPSISQFWDGEGAHLDFTSEAAIKFWQLGLRKSILELGISSAWNDNNEYELWEEEATCSGFGQPMGIELARSLQSLLMTRASYEEQEKFSPSERIYTITRAGCFGIQRYAQTWSGDNTTSWKTLRYNLRTGLQMSLSGLFNIGHDVGGFAGESPDPELLVRWIQTGILHPRFIMNSWKSDGKVTTPWLHQSVLPFTKLSIQLRYRLIPYFYTVYREAAEAHTPILRPTFYDFPEDEKCREVENDDLMLGPNLLAAPVVFPGKRERSLYLPEGPEGWYDFYTGEYFEAGKEVVVAAPLEKIPLFVPAGKVIPVTNSTLDFSQLHDEPSRLLRVFPRKNFSEDGVGEEDESFLWEDDGLSSAEGEESCRKLKFTLRSQLNEIVLSIKSIQGNFKLPFDVLHVALPPSEQRSLSIQAEGLNITVETHTCPFPFL